MKMKNIFLIIVGILSLVFWFSIELNITNLRYNTPVEDSLKNWWLLYGYLTLLLGVVLGVWVRGLISIKKTGEQKVKISQFLKSSLSKIDFWVAIFVSPIIYGSIIKVTPLPTIQFLYFALQTGFSSYVVIQAFFGDNIQNKDEIKKENSME